jgi:hypothetical protein
MNPTTEWRNLLTTPAFDRWAPVARKMWEAAGQAPVDGVLVMDPVAVAKLLRATGPLTAEGVTVDADHAVQFLLHDQYVSYTEGEERRDRLAAIAQSTFAAIEAGRWEFGDLVSALAEAVAERHVLLWSAVPDEARGWQRLGADGALDQNAIAVSVLNRGGNKLDWFLRVEADAQVRRSDRGDEVVVRVAVHNRTEQGEPAYIAGPHATLDVPYGTYRGLVEVVLPRGTSGARFDGFESYAASGVEDGFPVVAVPVELAPGESATFTARGDLRGPLVPELVPSARVPDVWSPGDDGA